MTDNAHWKLLLGFCKYAHIKTHLMTRHNIWGMPGKRIFGKKTVHISSILHREFISCGWRFLAIQTKFLLELISFLSNDTCRLVVQALKLYWIPISHLLHNIYHSKYISRCEKFQNTSNLKFTFLLLSEASSTMSSIHLQSLCFKYLFLTSIWCCTCVLSSIPATMVVWIKLNFLYAVETSKSSSVMDLWIKQGTELARESQNLYWSRCPSFFNFHFPPVLFHKLLQR